MFGVIVSDLAMTYSHLFISKSFEEANNFANTIPYGRVVAIHEIKKMSNLAIEQYNTPLLEEFAYFIESPFKD